MTVKLILRTFSDIVKFAVRQRIALLKTYVTFIFLMINNKTNNLQFQLSMRSHVTRVLTLYFAMAIHHVAKTINAIVLDNSTVFKSYLTLVCTFINQVT